MNRRVLKGLVALNLALVAALAWLSLSGQPAEGQMAGGAGNYVMVAGQRNGVTPDTVYVLDLSSGVLLGIEPQQRGRGGQLTPTGFRLVSNDFTR